MPVYSAATSRMMNSHSGMGLNRPPLPKSMNTGNVGANNSSRGPPVCASPMLEVAPKMHRGAVIAAAHAAERRSSLLLGPSLYVTGGCTLKSSEFAYFVKRF
jgi:hypothetical protein